MKKIKLLISISLVTLALGIPSCKKENVLCPVEQGIVQTVGVDEATALDEPVILDESMLNRANSTTYSSIPTVGGFTDYSSSSIVIGGTCGTHDGGVIKAKLQSRNGSQFTMKISKQYGGGFSHAGTAYIKSASLCGGKAGEK